MSFQKPNKVSSMSEALKKLEKYCAYQERSHKQVYDKCRSYGLSEADANELLVELIQSNFLNEERFVEAYVKGKFKIKSWGKQKISQGLKLAGVNQKLIQASIKEIKIDDTICFAIRYTPSHITYLNNFANEVLKSKIWCVRDEKIEQIIHDLAV
jgi:SOS response regulatory protein OraA/RecX